MKKSFRGIVALVAIGLFLGACTPAPTEPLFENAWIRSMPPGMKMTAGFGTVNNVTEGKIRLVAFSSPEFRNVSLHLSEVVDGVSSMNEVEGVTLEPGESLEMAPGGYHLMLMGPLKSMIPGRVVTIEMTSGNDVTYSFEVTVEKR